MHSQNKYSTSYKSHSADFIPEDITLNCTKFLLASYSEKTWIKNYSAMNCLKNFGTCCKIDVSLPLNNVTVHKFVEWCKLTKNLKTSTIKSYLHSLVIAHKLKNLDHSHCSSFINKRILIGMENLEFYIERNKKTRKVMTLPLLKLAGSEIAKSNWSQDSKQVIWSILTTSFFGSFRLGEILSKNEFSFNKWETLLWEDVLFRDDNSILIKIKIPKNRTIVGEFVDIFPFKHHKCCPVAALKKLRSTNFKEGKEKFPVFMFNSGKLATPGLINKILPQLLEIYLGAAAWEYKGHSLRPAIASALANDPTVAKDSEIRKWGRWNSTSYLLYCRLKLKQKRSIFDTISVVLNKQ